MNRYKSLDSHTYEELRLGLYSLIFEHILNVDDWTFDESWENWWEKEVEGYKNQYQSFRQIYLIKLIKESKESRSTILYDELSYWQDWLKEHFIVQSDEIYNLNTRFLIDGVDYVAPRFRAVYSPVATCQYAIVQDIVNAIKGQIAKSGISIPQSDIDLNELLNVKESAKFCGMSVKTFNTRVKEHNIKKTADGKNYRIGDILPIKGMVRGYKLERRKRTE